MLRRHRVHGRAAAIGGLTLGLGLTAIQSPAHADCTLTAPNTTTCDTNAPNPYRNRVGAGNTPEADDQTVTVDTGAEISVGDENAISLRDGANITVNGSVRNRAAQSKGEFITGANTIEFRDNGTLTVGVDGQVLSNGVQRVAEAVNVQGKNNTIINNGLINTVSGAAIWSQKPGQLNIVNNGRISTGALANPSLTADVIGGNSTIDFTNRGTVFGSLNLGGGSDVLRIYTGSDISGNFSGGGGEDSIYFNGTGTDSLGGSMVGFEHLIKQDSGTWELTGSLTGLTDANVEAGTLILTGNNTGFTGTTTVSGGAVLEGSSGSLPTSITNDGLVRFRQTSDGTYSGVIDGTGAFDKRGAGSLTITSAQVYSGPTSISEGALVLMGSLLSPTTVAAAGTLRGTGSITGLVTNEGVIAPGTHDAIGTLTINGSYIGNGGTLATRVGGTLDAPVADILRIEGAGSKASGTTAVSVIDAGGLGAPTGGDGIMVVQAADGATTGQGAFVLAGRVAAGAYDYNLVRGRSSGATENWYLQSYADEPVVPDPDPDYRVETANYTSLPALQRLYAYGLTDTLEQRRGAPGLMVGDAAAGASPIWGRIGGNFGELDGSGATGMDMSYAFGFMQAGIDAIAVSDGKGGRITSGAFLATGSSSTDTSTRAEGKTGDASFLAFSGGLYGTWVAANGLYADLLGQATRFANVEARSSGNQSISTGGWSESLSLESGYRIGLGARTTLIPQGQIIAENFSLDDAADDFGTVAFSDGFAARGRLGLELASRLDGAGNQTDLSLRANLWHVFSDDPETTFSSLKGDDPVNFQAEIGTSWLAIDAGFTTAINDHASLFVNAGYEYSLDDSRQAGTGRLGFTCDW